MGVEAPAVVERDWRTAGDLSTITHVGSTLSVPRNYYLWIYTSLCSRLPGYSWRRQCCELLYVFHVGSVYLVIIMSFISLVTFYVYTVLCWSSVLAFCYYGILQGVCLW